LPSGEPAPGGTRRLLSGEPAPGGTRRLLSGEATGWSRHAARLADSMTADATSATARCAAPVMPES
jgi:hypothetical protein